MNAASRLAHLFAGLAFFAPQVSAAATLGAILSRGHLRVCTTGDYAPFSLRQRGRGGFEGIDIDMARDLGRNLGVFVRFVPTSWPTLEADFLGGACDIAMGGISVKPSRRMWAAFSQSYRVGGKTAIARCSEVGSFQTLQQINRAGVRLLVNPGGTNERFAVEHLSRAELLRHPDNTEIFGMIATGKADVMVTDAIEVRLQARRDPRLCGAHPNTPFTRTEMAYLLPQGQDLWRRRVNLWLRGALREGRYQSTESRWLGPRRPEGSAW